MKFVNRAPSKINALLLTAAVWAQGNGDAGGIFAEAASQLRGKSSTNDNKNDETVTIHYVQNERKLGGGPAWIDDGDDVFYVEWLERGSSWYGDLWDDYFANTVPDSIRFHCTNNGGVWSGEYDSSKRIAEFVCDFIHIPDSWEEYDNEYVEYKWAKMDSDGDYRGAVSVFATFSELDATGQYGRLELLGRGRDYAKPCNTKKPSPNGKCLSRQGNTITGSLYSDLIVGGSEDDFLYGSYGNDILRGDAGADHLDGGDGADWLFTGELEDGSEGTGDILVGGAGADKFVIGVTETPTTTEHAYDMDWKTIFTSLAFSVAGGVSDYGFARYGTAGQPKKAEGFVPVILDVIQLALFSSFQNGVTYQTYDPPQAAHVKITDFNPREDVIIIPLNHDGHDNIDISYDTQGGDNVLTIKDTTGTSTNKIASVWLCDVGDFLDDPSRTVWASKDKEEIQRILTETAIIVEEGEITMGGTVLLQTANDGLLHSFEQGEDEILPAVGMLNGLGATRFKLIGAVAPYALNGDGDVNHQFGTNMNDVLSGYEKRPWSGLDMDPENSGSDRLYGFDGDDLFFAGAGINTIFGGEGQDTVSYADAIDTDYPNVFVNMTNLITDSYGRQYVEAENGWGDADRLYSIERIIGSPRDDTIIGDSQNNRFWTTGGNDVFTGNAGRDIFTNNGGSMTITDYNPDKDKIEIDSYVFPADCSAWGSSKFYWQAIGNDLVLFYYDTVNTAIVTLLGKTVSDKIRVQFIGPNADCPALSSHIVACGSQYHDNCPSDKPMQANNQERYAVRCCSDTDLGLPGWVTYADPHDTNAPLYHGSPKDSDDNCYNDATYSEALAICGSVGAQLCSLEDVMRERTIGGQCGHDTMLFWTSSTNSHFKVCGSGDNSCGNNIVKEERNRNPVKPLNHLAGVKCCSDTGVSSDQADGQAPWTQVSGCSNYAAEMDFYENCYTSENWYSAERICKYDFGGRLCTMQEIESGCAVAAEVDSCGLDSSMVWSSTSPANMHWVELGRGGWVPDKVGRLANDQELFDVRCCSDEQKSGGWVKNDSCGANVWGGSICSAGKVTFGEAAATCLAQGARLCTRQELQRDCAAATGCDFDSELVWTSTPLHAGHYAVCGGDDCMLGDSIQAPDSDLLAVRCCSETNLFIPSWMNQYGLPKKSNCPYGGSKDAAGTCYSGKTFSEAQDICDSLGARLCTVKELQKECAGTHCNFDDQYVWSQDAYDPEELVREPFHPDDRLYTIETKREKKTVYVDGVRATLKSDGPISAYLYYFEYDESDGYYRIHVAGSSWRWYIDSNSQLVTVNGNNDDLGKFKLFQDPDGTVTFVQKNTNNVIHADLDGQYDSNKRLSVRAGAQESRDTRFYLQTFEMQLSYEDFENGWGSDWNDGGSDSSVSDYDLSPQGQKSLRLRDDSSTSEATSIGFNVASFRRVTVCFSFVTNGFDPDEFFSLRYRLDALDVDNDNFNFVETFSQVDDETRPICLWNFCFEDGVQYNHICRDIDVSTGSTLHLRFENHASSDNDKVYIDEVEVIGG